jgi:hypothetical protein
MSRWVRVDRRYNQPYRFTGYAYRAIFKWTGLLFLWIVVNGILSAAHLGLLTLATTAGLVWYAVHCARRSRQLQLTSRTQQAQQQVTRPANWRFNPPPDWPLPSLGWRPPAGWQPDPSWPPPPPGWQFWLPDEIAPVGERNTRVIPQDVKIKVAARDGGRCRQCGSTEELHLDHVVPWSKGGANTVANIQLLCGPCNRRKGAVEISV